MLKLWKSLAAVAALSAVAAPMAFVQAADLEDLNPEFSANTDNPGHSLGDAQKILKEKALQAVLNGKAKGPVVEVARGQYVELSRQGEDSIWTVLGEFGDLESPFGVLQGGAVGPQRNQIPEPDRSVDNTTIWAPDFSEEYYENLLFSEEPGAVSMRNFYIEASSNRYAVNGDVTDWGQVPYRAAHYGRDWCGGIVCGQTTWWFIRDSLNAWYQSQLDAGKSPAEIDAYLSQFDVWDRYDHDGDGDFNEPDGYIDHFQSVHAGEGQETGGGSYGSDAIWSHRWYVQLTPIGGGGPTLDDGTVVPFGGQRVGGSKYWIGDYTIEPENGGVGVFAHEFAHDLGLPDQYDTAGNTCGSACENSTAFWTIMSSGSYLNDGTTDLGSKPGHFNAWEKFQLGWLNYEVAFAGQRSTHKLGPAETNTKQAQGLFVVLPLKEKVEQIGVPYSGSYFYYSGAGNNLDNSMSRSVTLPAGAVTLTAMVNYEIETDWDYAYLTVNGTSVETNLSTTTDPHGQNFGYGITDFSGGWIPLTADLSAFAGQTVEIGFRYWTDVAAVELGFMVDDVQITGQPLDDAESDFGWTFNGFNPTTGTETTYHNHYYVAEFRQYRGYDEGLRDGAYNFGFTDVSGTWVERFPYQDGLLVSYWDTSQTDNSTSAHPGEGLILPIDAHPGTMYDAFGNPWRARIQSYDSTFSLAPTDAITLHRFSQPSAHPSLPGASVFDDSIQYYNPETPTAGVINPHTGTTIRIVSISALGSFMQVIVNN